MEQEKIWDFYQNEGVAHFAGSTSRYTYLAKRIARRYPRRGAHVLNIGIGSGGLELRLQAIGFKVSAVDPNERSLALLIEHDIDARVGFAERLPWKDGAFDAVVATEVLEHLEPDRCKIAIREITRVLKISGLFLATVPFEEKLDDYLVVCPHCGDHFHRWGHQQSFTISSFRNLFSDGFTVERISCRTFPEWEGGIPRKLKSAARWCLGRMGQQIADPHIVMEARRKI